MRIAIAGAGGLARYISEEFRKYGHSVVILTRSEKGYFRNRPLVDCEILISVILSYATEFLDIHLNLIKACKLSPKCKRFIPSEFFGDVENYPDLPPLYSEVREPLRKTLVCNGNLYLMDIGEGFPIDTIRNRIVIPGTGKDAVDPYAYVSGTKMYWNDLAQLVQKRYPAMREVKRNSNDQEELLLAHYKIFVPLGAVSFDPDKVEAHWRKFFAGLQFPSPGQLIDEVEEDPDKVV
ncbi:hypothetical protein BDV33DRAFT_189285 [Aspergillus novoparasiticus]|uniref:NmrA-like domain-containing protein n=1 Tax=Aspergillus novoparasiticus TaxID=986946 RepID=A0A5N6EZ58_9EURO|nr:hypothetical protein BDV33DRAFT_189285 [Aspergillus novoparasiticus]